MDIERRIERLERENRKLKWALMAVVVVGAGALLMAQAAPEKIPEVVRARKFEVVNSSGIAVVTLESWRQGGWIDAKNNAGKTLVAVAADEGGNGYVTTMNGKGQQLVKLVATTEGEGVISTMNGKGQELVELRTTEGGNGAVTTMNGRGQELVMLGATKGGDGGTVQVLNKTGQKVCTLMVDEYGNGEIGAWDRNGKGRTLTPGP